MLTRDPSGAAVLGGIRLADLVRPPSADVPDELAPASGLVVGGVRTPAYVYDLGGIAEAARDLAAGLGSRPHLIAYAVKANSAGPIIRALAKAGCGAEVVSGGELALVTACELPPDRILFSGVAKTAPELDLAIGAGDRGILAIQMESVEEIPRVDARAAAVGRRARVSIRVNPGVEADTHSQIATGHDEAKFGVAVADIDRAIEALARAPRLELGGVSCHIGSQLMTTSEYGHAAETLVSVTRKLEAAGHRLAFIDFGGGFGVDYGGSSPSPPSAFAAAIVSLMESRGLTDKLAVVEPGRALVAAHGVLCATVVSPKRSGDRRWLLIDAGMNDLVRPAMYGAKHRIEPLDAAPAGPSAPLWRVVGPVCESSDDFGAHPFDDPPPSQVIIRDAGAYGYVMACEYNGRALPTEVFVESGRVVAVSSTRRVDDWVSERARIGAPT